MPQKRPNRRSSASGSRPSSNKPARPSSGRDKSRSNAGKNRTGFVSGRAQNASSGSQNSNETKQSAAASQQKPDAKPSQKNKQAQALQKANAAAAGHHKVDAYHGKPNAGASSDEGKSQGKGKAGAVKPTGKPANTKPRKGAKSTPFQNITEMVKWVDLVVEVLDARLPLSTRHPMADEIFGRKPRLLVLAKSDLADAEETRHLIDQIKHDTGIECLLVSLKTSAGKGQIMSACVDATKEKLQALVKKGILPRPMRVCVVGLPNVGKSSLINWLIGQNRTKTGNRPGITKGTQWVRVHPKLELLDTPGILPSASFSKTVKDRLAVCNLIPDTTYNFYEIAEEAILMLRQKYPRLLEGYIQGLSVDGTGLLEVAKARNLLTSGAKPDVPRAAALSSRSLEMEK